MRRDTSVFPRRVVVLLMLWGMTVPGFSQTVSAELADAARAVCAGGLSNQSCTAVHAFDSGFSAIVLIEDTEWRSTSFVALRHSGDSWQIVQAGPFMDLEVMAVSPDDPFAFDGYDRIRDAMPPDELLAVLGQVSSFLDEQSGGN